MRKLRLGKSMPFIWGRVARDGKGRDMFTTHHEPKLIKLMLWGEDWYTGKMKTFYVV